MAKDPACDGSQLGTKLSWPDAGQDFNVEQKLWAVAFLALLTTGSDSSMVGWAERGH